MSDGELPQARPDALPEDVEAMVAAFSIMGGLAEAHLRADHWRREHDNARRLVRWLLGALAVAMLAGFALGLAAGALWL